MRHRDRSKYFNRIFTVLVLIGVVPVIILGVVSYRYSSRIDQDRVREANARALERSQNDVEQTLVNIQNYYLILSADAFREYENLTMQEMFLEYDRLIDLQRRLLDFQNLEAAVHTAYFVNLDEDWIVGNDGIGAFSDFVNKDVVNAVIRSPRTVLWTSIPDPADTTLHMNISKLAPVEQNFMGTKYPLNATLPIGVLIVNLYTPALAARLSNDDVNRNTIVLEPDGGVVFQGSRADAWVAGSHAELIAAINAHADGQGFFYETLANGRVGVTYRHAELTDWVYATVYSVREITASSRAIGLATSIVLVVTIVLVIFASFFGSSMLARPVHDTFATVRRFLSGAEGGPERDEFAYIDRGIHLLADSRSELEQTIREQVSRLQEFFLLDLIHGRISAEEIESRYMRLGLDEKWRIMSVVTIQIDDSTPRLSGRYGQSLLLVSLRDAVRTFVPEVSRLQPTISRNGVVALLGAANDDARGFRDDVTRWLASVRTTVARELGVSVSGGVSRIFERFEHARIAERESAEALMFRKRTGESVLLFYADLVRPDTASSSGYPEALEAELLNAIHAVDESKAIVALGTLVDRISEATRDPNELELALVRLSVEVIRLLQDVGEPAGFLSSSQSIFEQMRSLVEPEDIKRRFAEQIVMPTIERLRDRRSRHFREILEKVITMIESEYDTDLTLESCARRLNYHPSHIWRILKDELETTFSDYLGRYRISVAKRWLAETDRPVNEIAEALRYSNSQNFIRFYKRVEGMTPGQFRDSIPSRMGKQASQL